MNGRLRVFVASSSEQVKVAEEVAELLNESPIFEARAWREGVFEFSKSYMESLEAELDRADFAVVILTAADTGNVRGKKVNLPRDNVILELGLFSGRLGRERCFFFVDGTTKTKIASDLSGVKPVEFYPRRRGVASRKPDLRSQVAAVRRRMRKLSVRYKPPALVRERQDALWRFSTRFAGHWWERMRMGHDDKSALSFLTVTINEVTNTPQLEGKAYGKRGEALADWRTISTEVELGGRPKIFYRWEGEHETAHGQVYGGGGFIRLNDERLEEGEGYFYDTNFAQISKGTRVKNFRLRRCPTREVRLMTKPWTKEAASLIKKRLNTLKWR